LSALNRNTAWYGRRLKPLDASKPYVLDRFYTVKK